MFLEGNLIQEVTYVETFQKDPPQTSDLWVSANSHKRKSGLRDESNIL